MPGHRIPGKGDRIAQRRTGITRVGRVWYADELQVLVKWDDGTSSSLRLGADDFDVLDDQSVDAHSVDEALRSRLRGASGASDDPDE